MARVVSRAPFAAGLSKIVPQTAVGSHFLPQVIMAPRSSESDLEYERRSSRHKRSRKERMRASRKSDSKKQHADGTKHYRLAGAGVPSETGEQVFSICPKSPQNFF